LYAPSVDHVNRIWDLLIDLVRECWQVGHKAIKSNTYFPGEQLRPGKMAINHCF